MQNRKSFVPPIKKNAEAVVSFQQTIGDALAAAIPVATTLPIKVWASDESRFGLHTVRRRRITARGTKPICHHQHAFQNFWIYGAVAPASGESHFMELPTLDSTMFQRFLDDFASTHANSLNVLLVDNARSHRAQTLHLPANVILLFQPPYAPEVNPCERVWLAFKSGIAWQCFSDLDTLRQYMVALVNGYTAEMLQSLTAYSYLIDAINTLSA